MINDNVVEQKSFNFAVRIVNLYRHLLSEFKEYTISKQILRSGTSIGANVAEAIQAQSRPDFVSKLNIALKESTETKYWLKLMKATGYLTEKEYNSLFDDCTEIEKILTTIIKTTKKNSTKDLKRKLTD